MFVRSLVATSAAVLLAAVGLAQDQIDRRSRDEPEMTYQSGGRVGTCDVVRFTPDGKFLFAAGDDKVVRGWPATADGLDLDPRKGETLRWPAWREGRGGIKAIAISPDGKRIAVGGVGLITSAVAILERSGTEGKVAALTWPKVKDGGRHFDAVTAVAFDPAGKRVAFGTADGSLWVWTPAIQAEDKDGRTWSAPVLAGRHDITDKKVKQDLAEKGLLRQGDFASRLVYFQGEAVVSVCRMGQVLECPITADLTANPEAAAPVGKELFNAKAGAGENKLHPGRVFKAERTADGKGLVVALSEKWVLVQSLDDKTQARLELPADHFPRSVAVHPTSGMIAVGVGRLVPHSGTGPRFFAEQDDEIWVYDAPKDKAEPGRKLSHPGRAEALAFHPTAKDRLAVAGGDADEVTVYDGAAAKPLAVARGAGRKVFAVEMTSTGKLLRFRTARDQKATHPNAHAAGDWHGFDLNAVKRTADTGDAGRTWVGTVSEADGWTVVPDADHRAVWWVTGHGKKARLDIDPARFNDPTCYTFLPADARAGTPTRLLVGHYHGCSLFDLPPAGGPLPELLAPARIYFGHLNEVLGIAAAKDGTWFVTAGADHTLAAFALDKSAAPPALGARFEPTPEDTLRVTDVTVGSPAWEAGLQVDDRIDLLTVGGDLTFDRRKGRPTAGTPAAALKQLAEAKSGVTHMFGLLPKGGGQPRLTQTTLPHRPLWKLYPQFDASGRMTEWVAWMWKGSYYAASTNGDRQVGWHVNAPVRAGTPRFHKLAEFADQYHNPEAVKLLIAKRDLGEALLEARGENAQQPLSFAKTEVAPVGLKIDVTRVGEADIPVTLTVTPRSEDVDLMPEVVELWVNDHRLGKWPGGGKREFTREAVLKRDVFRPGENQVTVRTFNPAGGWAADTHWVTDPRPAPPASLYTLAVGVNDYGQHRLASAGARGSFDDLKFAVADAAALTAEFGRHVGSNRFFPDGRLTQKTDAEAARAKLLADLAELKKPGRTKATDLLVVFVAGHGAVVGDAKGGKPTLAMDSVKGLKNLRLVFCCNDFDVSNPAATSVAAAELFDALAEVNCRKVVLLDVCHAGQALEQNAVRRFLPGDHGPLVLAACEAREQSFEHPALRHGLFTAALLEAVGPDRRAYKDGALTARGLAEYVKGRVPQMCREIGAGGKGDEVKRVQNPIEYLPLHADTVLMRTVRGGG